MSGADPAKGQLERELAYYRRELNDVGARLLRLQEEQSQAFREARRSRTVAKLIREAYRLADNGSGPDELGKPMLDIIIDSVMCDAAAFLREDESEPGRFAVTHAIGAGADGLPDAVELPTVPGFFFTTSRTPIEPPAYELTRILRLPYVLWGYDGGTGHALILGNRSEGNVNRPFEQGDQELVEGALSVYVDVLQRKSDEVALRKAKLAAEEASATRSRFLATLTHELRTPLNAIIGFSEMMVSTSTYRLTAAQRDEYTRQILESGQHLLSVINDILDYSSLAQAAPSLRTRWLPARELLRGAVGEATALAVQKNIEIRLAAFEADLLLDIDGVRFRQVLANLLGNAVKFTPPGGRVIVSGAARADGGADLEISDTGVGMRAEDIPRALEPFRQLESGSGRIGGGTGLGLPIAKGLVEAHGGALTIESVPARGTRVVVTLPTGRVSTRATTETSSEG